jgi:hypothetical protein
MSERLAAGPVDLRLEEPLAECRQSGDGVGFVGPDIPIDVLLASGRSFGHLPWRAGDPTPWADQWLESSFPFYARSILEQWHQGDFDSLDSVVFSRADDASQRLFYYVAELRRRKKLNGPSPHLFDIAHVRRESSLAHTEAAVVELMQALDVAPSKLPAGIEAANRLRLMLAGIGRSRASEGPFYERLARAVLWSDPTEWIDEISLPVAEASGPRVLLAGSMPVDDRLHRVVEAAGANVVAEAHAFALERLGSVIRTDGSPLERSIARHLREHSVAPRAFIDRAAWIVEQATAASAVSVIIWLTREDEALAWAVPGQVRALTAAGISVLVLPAAGSDVDRDSEDRIASYIRAGARDTA